MASGQNLGLRLVDTGRLARTAATWVRKATRHLQANAHETVREQRWLTGYDAETLLEVLLEEADTLAGLLNDADDTNTYQRERVEQLAKALAQRLRNARLASKLSQVEGRTAEEAEAFLARAAELRRSAGDDL